LNAVVAYEPHPAGYFAAITAWNLSPGLVVPQLFVWNRATGSLAECMRLHPVGTPFAKQVQKLIHGLRV
jgi:hypothetical protein